MPTKKDDQTPIIDKAETKDIKAEAEIEAESEEKKEDVKKVEKKDEKKIEKKTAKKEVKKSESKAINIGDKKHGNYYNDVEVNCICGANFTINTTVPGPIKVETCYQCHPLYNKDKVINKVVKGRLEKFLEKQKRMDSMKK